MRTAFFWVITQRVVAIPYRHSEQPICPPEIGCTETSVRNRGYSLRNNPEKRSSGIRILYSGECGSCGGLGLSSVELTWSWMLWGVAACKAVDMASCACQHTGSSFTLLWRSPAACTVKLWHEFAILDVFVKTSFLTRAVILSSG